MVRQTRLIEKPNRVHIEPQLRKKCFHDTMLVPDDLKSSDNKLEIVPVLIVLILLSFAAIEKNLRGYV